MLTNIMSRREIRNRFKNESNKKITSDKDHIIPKESCAVRTPKSKEFWNSIPAIEKDSLLGSARDKPKHKPPFSRKENKSEIEGLIYQCLTFEEVTTSEDDGTPE